MPDMKRSYSEEDLKDITLHVYAMGIAMGSITPLDARLRVKKVLDWLDDHGRLLYREGIEDG